LRPGLTTATSSFLVDKENAMRHFCGFVLVGIMAAGCGQTVAAETTKDLNGQDVREFTYKTASETDLKLHVHYPKDWKASDKRPGIVFFFGGGWSGGSPSQFIPQASYFASRGMVCARADYRVKSRQGVTPDKCVEDATSAIRWFRKNAKKLGVDPDRIVSSGGSAGGHLAACMGTDSRLDTEGEDTSISAKANAMLLYNPALQFAGIEKMMQRLGAAKDKAEAISPTLNLKKGDPPALLLYGSKDFLLEQCKAWMAKAEKIGHKSELYTAPDQSHGFFNRSPWLERTTKRADEFLTKIGYLTGEPTIQEGDFKDWKKPSGGTRKRPARKK